MAELKITFSGICTHFWGVIPGVPMRTVIPNTASANLRAVTMMNEVPVAMPFSTMPHVPLLVVTDDQVPPKILGTPLVLAGARLQIVNADFSAPSQIPTRPDGGFSLTSYVENFSFSDDVVFNGRASCYFDNYVATDLKVNGTRQQARSTTITLNTIDTPQLLITPFPGSLMPLQQPLSTGQPWLMPITGQLWVMNVDFDQSPAVTDPQFDFMLNYLVALGSIPNQLISPAPGMPPPSQWPPLQDPTPLFVGQQFQSAVPQFQSFATFATQFNSTAEMIESIANSELASISSIMSSGSSGDPVGANESCSDSNYP